VRQLGIAVKSDDEADIRKSVRVTHVDQRSSGLWPCAVDQAVQLLQFAPFALPADEFLLGFAPGALAMEEKKTLAAMALAQLSQQFFCGLEQPAVIFPGQGD